MVNQINLNDILFSPLKQDYEKEQSPIGEFTSGLDYMEVMVKFLGVLSINVLKDADEAAYQEVFFKNFKLSPSLGDFKSLSTQCYTKDRMKVVSLKNHTFYQALSQIFKKTFSTQLHLTSIDTLLFSTQSKPIILSNLWELLENYVVTFRNKTKGHGASFRADDVGQIQGFNDTLKQINTTLEAKIDEILKLEGLSFSFEPKEEKTDDGHAPEKVFALWEGRQIPLSPLLIHLTCKSYSCQHKPHRVKLFFYNDGKDAKSYYIDYSYNHFFYFSQNNEVASTLEEMLALQKAIDAHQASDENRYTNLLDHFVGREEELKAAQEHLLSTMQSQRSSAIVIKGKPGIGKSAFLSKLQSELCVDKTNEHLSYIFYARKGNMGVDEIQYAYNKITNYLNENGIKAESPKSEEEANKSERNEETYREKFERLFNALDTQNKPFLLMIDGLDEFDKPEDLIKTLPLENHKHLHIVFSTREYKHLLDALETKLFRTDKPLHVMGAQNYKAIQCSLSLGALKEHEAKSLIAEVLTKDIKRESSAYQEILEAIYIRSEALPLYIRYICEHFKTLELTDVTNIAQTVLEYAKALPNGLDNFYHQSFKELSTLSSSILYILYFSRTKVSFDELYTLCQTTIDNKEFHQAFFSKVEIFLSKEEKSYGFYHLSVKEAIKNYFMLDNNTKAIVELDLEAFHTQHYLPENFRREYERLKESFYYLKQESDLFAALEKLYTMLGLENKDAKLEKYYAKNYLHVAFEYINIKLLQETISFEEMENKAYEKLGSYTISSSLKKSIDVFFKAYRTIKPYDEQQQIRYAFELAFLSKRYKELLDCSVDYKKAILNWVVKICTSPYDEKSFKEFKEMKEVWSNVLSQDCLAILAILTTKKINVALEISEKINNDYLKSKVLATIVTKIEDMNRALEIVTLIESDEYKSKALIAFAKNVNDVSIIDRILDIAKTIQVSLYKDQIFADIALKLNNIKVALMIVDRIEENADKYKTLSIVAAKSDNLKSALEIVTLIEDDEYKLYALVNIAEKFNDNAIFENALEIVELIKDDWKKSQAIVFIAEKTNNSIILERMLEIVETIQGISHKSGAFAAIATKIEDIMYTLEVAETIQYDWNKSKILTALTTKTNDVGILQRILAIAETIEDYIYEFEVYAAIDAKLANPFLLNYALDIIEMIEDNEYKSELLAVVIRKSNDISILQRGLEIIKKINNDYFKSEIFTDIIEKTNDITTLHHILEITKTISNWNKSKTLIDITIKINDINILKHALEIAETIQNEKEKYEAIITIASEMGDINHSLAIAESIENDEYKSFALVTIVETSNEIIILNRILDITESIEDEHKSRVLITIAKKTNDNVILERALEIAETIKYSLHKSEAIAAIVNKTEDDALLKRALEITEPIEDEHKSRVLIAIAKKINDINILKHALEIAETIQNEKEKYEAIITIASEMGDINHSLAIAESIENDEYKSFALVTIVETSNEIIILNRILDITESIEDEHKSRVLITIAKKTNDNVILERALEIAETIKYSLHKSEAIAAIVNKTEDDALLKRALEITEPIEDEHKSRVLIAIAKKTNDINILKHALEIAETIQNEKEKYEAIITIASEMGDINHSLAIAESIENDEYKSFALVTIVETSNEIIILNRILDITESIEDEHKSRVLITIAKKTNDNVILERALEIAETIKYSLHKSEAIAAIVNKTEDDALLKRALEITEPIEDEHKSRVLIAIAKKTNDINILKHALEIAETIQNEKEKYEAMITITSEMGDINHSLAIAESIENDEHKSRVLITIAKKTNDDVILERALEIAETIKYSLHKSEAIAAIVEKTEDDALLKRALDITESIEDNYWGKKTKILVIIAGKTKNTTLLQHILKITQDFVVFNTRYFTTFSLPEITYIKYTNHLVKQKMDSILLGVNEALGFVMQISHKSVLEHYGIVFEEELTPLQKVVKKLKELKQLRDEAEAKEDEVAYEKADEDAKNLKQELLADESLCEAFCEAFSLSKMKLKSADILALEYDDAF